jgi:hypothetical protein
MAFAILRIEKHSSRVSLRRSGKHNFREQETPNADPARSPLNTTEGAQSTAELLLALDARLPQTKIRTNAVLAVEYFVGMSPEWQGDHDSYFADARKWLEAKHGRENVICCTVHKDETTPHMAAFVVPIDERGKLNARGFFGGPKALKELQTDFAEKVGKQHGMQRGIEGSKAKHQRVQSFYAALNGEIPAPTLDPTPRILQKKLFSNVVETRDEVKERLRKEVSHTLRAAKDAVEQANWRAYRAEAELARIPLNLREMAARDRAQLSQRIADEQAVAQAERDARRKTLNRETKGR